jgi:hypothetical protein
MKQMMRKEVGSINMSTYSFSPQELINKLKQLIELYGDTLRFEKSYEDRWYTKITVEELESDSEYERRLQQEAFVIEEREFHQRKMYAILKAKFEN